MNDFFKNLSNKYKIIIGCVLFVIIILIILIPGTRYWVKYHVLEQFQTQPKYFFEQGVKYQEKGYIQYSIGTFKRALHIKNNEFNLEPGNLYQLESLFNLAVLVYQNEKNYTQALYYFNQYMDMCEKFSVQNTHAQDIYNVVNYILSLSDSSKNQAAKKFKSAGNDAYFKKEFDLAIKNYKQALVLDPAYAEVYNNLATTYYAMNNFKDAVNYWQVSLLFTPKDSYLYINIGLAYETKLNNPAKALEYYKRYLENSNPNDESYNDVKTKVNELESKQPHKS